MRWRRNCFSSNCSRIARYRSSRKIALNAMRPSAYLSDALSSRKVTSPLQLGSDHLDHTHSTHQVRVSYAIVTQYPLIMPFTMQSLSIWQPQQHPPIKTEVDSRQLTMKIKSCRSWQELRDVCMLYCRVFNSIHLAAAITHLAQINSQAASIDDRILSGKYASTRDYGAAFTLPGSRRRIKTDASNTTRLIDRGGYSSLLDSLLQEVLRHPERFTGRQISNMVWAVARLHSKYTPQANSPVASFMKSAVLVSLSLRGQLLPQHLASLSYGLALLRHDPGRQWIQNLVQESLESMNSFKPCELVMLTFSLHKLLPQLTNDSTFNKRVSFLLHSVIAASKNHMSEYSGKELSGLALSLTSLARIYNCEKELHRSPSDWMLNLLKSAQERLNAGDLNPQCISCLLLAFSSCTRQSDKCYDGQLSSLLNHIMLTSEPSLSHWSLQALSNTYISIAQLRYLPSDRWMISFETSIERHLSQVLGESRTRSVPRLTNYLGNIIYGMSIFQWKPSLSFISAFLACCSIIDMNENEVNQIILSLKRLGVVSKSTPTFSWDRSKRKDRH